MRQDGYVTGNPPEDGKYNVKVTKQEQHEFGTTHSICYRKDEFKNGEWKLHEGKVIGYKPYKLRARNS